MNKFQKILIPNRGEIARRIIQAVHELGYTSVLVYSREDAKSLAVQEADEAYRLEGTEVGETYLNIPQILSIAKQSGVQAIHPGYGFLSENPAFAGACEASDIVFIGPDAKTLTTLGDKVASKQLAEAAGVPTLPGKEDPLPKGKALEKLADKIGFPLLIKAAAGGGGKGMRVLRQKSQLEEAIAGSRREAQAYFGSDKVFIEKYLEQPRHVEVQILGDTQGNVFHLYERECSMQRRHQKMIEESPSPSINEKLRTKLCDAALKLAKKVGYVSAGTMEFLLDEKNNFYFLEANTRLQVEHAVTELVTGIDIVKSQIKIAEGHRIPINQSDIVSNGHALECRLYAEDPLRDFLPSEGKVGVLREPARPGVRIDSGLWQGEVLSSLYDPLLAKLVVHGANRKEALAKMVALLEDYVLLGVTHNLDFMRFLIQNSAFQKGRYHTHTVQETLPQFLKDRRGLPPPAWLVATLARRQVRHQASPSEPGLVSPLEGLKGFRNVR